MTEPKPQNDDQPVSEKKRDSSRSEQPNSGRLLLYVLVGLALLTGLYSIIFGPSRIETMPYSEFIAKIEKGKLDTTNVYKLKIGPTYITFQDTKDPESGEKLEVEPKKTRVPVANMGDDVQKELTGLLKEKGIVPDWPEEPVEWQTYLFLAILTAPFILLVVLMLRRMGGPGSALAFGRSRGKVYAQDDIDVTFDDVAGIDEAVEELKEVVEFLSKPGKYQALGGRIPKGVLLVGPPGTGKTLLAKAVAGEAGVPFISLSGSDFVEMYVGVGAARVRDMFQQAAQRSPCIIFIDELDALGKTRSGGAPGSHDEREQTLNALLVEMDGFGSDQSVIVMAATNRPETLDPALMRPGRFDRNVLVDRPDIRGREKILKVHCKKIKIDDSVEVARLAKLTPGFVGADLANLVNEAALLAARRDRKAVTMHDFEEGFERVVAGLEKQSRVFDEEEKTRTAYHECGHALVACSLPHTDPVHKISVIPRGMALGYTMHRPDSERYNKTQTELTNSICCLLGGIGAERVIFDETSVGAQNDLQRATDIARRMVTEFGMSPLLGTVHYSERRSSPFLGSTTASEPAHSEETIREIDLEVRRIIDECLATVLQILRDRKVVLEQMTKELLEVEVMDADHLKRILDEHHPGARIVPGTFADKASGNANAGEVGSGAETEAKSS
ncbi:MAG: ATP-dependent zinc metalloprotease FtsH [Planctomycetota bacterium]|nr:ATP-dependent zinc metalloprotease FtsH [Planctomycetota bacterium]MDA1251322.1 ATP-dependent zinc metalloprotease FtsH [Planctomycetota bacterium]